MRLSPMRLTVLLATALLVLAAVRTAGAQTLPDGFYLENAIGGNAFTQPVATAVAPDGTIFVAEKRGLVWVARGGVRLPTPFIDLNVEVLSHHDRGLLGLALDPDFASNGHVYLLYTVDHNGAGDVSRTDAFARLTRYTVQAGNRDRADLASRRVLLGETFETGIPSCYFSHTIGTVLFGADGTLLVGTGDGAHYGRVDAGGEYASCFGPGRLPASEDIGSFRSLRLESLAGKILRVDPETGRGLPSNPFYTGDPDDAASKVWALGLRNPFRFSIAPDGSTDPADGRPGTLYIGDVGWNVWEELNVARGGENFGWPCYEGPVRHTGYQSARPATNGCDTITDADTSRAAFNYHHSNADLSSPPGRTGASIVGGDVYRGVRYPAAYRGAVFFGDYSRGWLASARLRADGHPTGGALFAPNMGPVVHIGYDPVGQHLLLTNIGTGRVLRLRHTAGDANAPPVAQAGASPRQGVGPLRVQFVGSASFDPNGEALTYHWDFGDGATSTEPDPEHVYAAAGRYTATLRVTDAFEVSATETVQITVGAGLPAVAILTPTAGAATTPGQTVRLDLLATHPVQPTSTLGIDWRITQVHQDHDHPDVFEAQTRQASFVVPNHGDAGEVVFYRIEATVTDDYGLQATDVRLLRVATSGEADVTAEGEPVASADDPALARIADGDFPPEGTADAARHFATAGSPGTDHFVGYTFAEPQTFSRLLFQEGAETAEAGWWQALRVEVRQGGVWQPVPILHSLPAYEGGTGATFESFALLFQEVTADGIRLAGPVAGGYATVGELRAFARRPDRLPAPWASADIGAPATGYAVYADGEFEVGGGGDVWLERDNFRFVSQTLVGNGTLTARLRTVEGENSWAKAGLMVRASSAPDAPHAFLFRTAGEGAHLQHRPSAGAPMASAPVPAAEGFGLLWLRVQRQGPRVVAYVSPDGVTWTPAGTVAVALGEAVEVGLAVSAADYTGGLLAAARFDGVSLDRGGTTLPLPWASADVGTPPAAGQAAGEAGTFVVYGGGDVWNTADSFHLVHQPLAAAEAAITARLDALEAGHPWAKAGVTVRASGAPGAAHAFLTATTGAGVRLQYRPADGALSLDVPLDWGRTAPVWLRLVRDGDTLTPALSSDGQNWAEGAPVTVALGASPLAGLAVSAADYGDRSERARAAFSGVQVVGGGAALPAPWASRDVGAPPGPGGATFADEAFAVRGGGDVWNTADSFHLVHQPLPSDGALTARVTALDADHPWAKAGLMLRASEAPDAAHAFLAVTDARGLRLQFRPALGAPTQDIPLSWTQGVPFWVRLQRTGERVTAFTSPDGQAWTDAGTVDVALGAAPLAGLAVSAADYGDRRATARAVFSDVALDGSGMLWARSDEAPRILVAPPFGVERVFPNPTRGGATIRVQVEKAGMHRVEVYDLLGRQLAARLHEEPAPGLAEIALDLPALPAGVYLLRVVEDASGRQAVRRLTVVR
ncbi:MAG: PQQ-dependent sugar dehydrogenase [Rubricoccaceae bacterium]